MTKEVTPGGAATPRYVHRLHTLVRAPGASVTVKLKFLNPNPNGSLRYRTRVLTGAGAR